MWWYIIVFSIMFVLLILQQFQIDKANKKIRHLEERVEKHNEAILRILRGF